MHASAVSRVTNTADAYAANTYEVQGFSAGEWRILHNCATAAEAMHEVATARCDKGYLGIRVTVQTYDQLARKYFSRVVYHYSPLTEVQPPVAKVINAMPRIEPRKVKVARSNPVTFLARNSLVATRLAFVVGVGVVAFMALGFY